MEQQAQVQAQVQVQMDVEPRAGGRDAPQRAQLPHIENPVVCETLDLESYISRYDGYAKINRLVFIAERCINLQADAYRLALEELKKGINTTYYAKVASTVGDALGPNYAFDAKWQEETDRHAQQQLDRLEAELNTNKNRMIKDSIRMGYNDLGEFHYSRGDLQSALKCYVRTRDYCVLHKHSADMCTNVIKVCADLANWRHISNYVAKGEQLDTHSRSAEFASKLTCASALVALYEQQFKMAGRRFTSVEIVDAGFSQVLAPEDIAVYGTLCALATFTRQELRKKVFDNTTFKSLLDLVPRVRELASDFFHGRYGSCLKRLMEFKPELELDVHLHKHVDALAEKIRDALYTQYFSPYLSVDLRRMADAFSLSVSEVEESAAKLIAKDRLPARIDSQSKTLHRKQHDDRCTSLEKVLRLSETHLRETHTALLRLSLLQYDFTVSHMSHAIVETSIMAHKELCRSRDSGSAVAADDVPVEMQVPQHNQQDGSG